MAIASINPATGEVIRHYQELTPEEVEARLLLAGTAFTRFRTLSFSERAQKLLTAADLLEARRLDLGRIITIEMGKPIKASITEIVKCASVCRYYAEHGERYLASEPVSTTAVKSFVLFEPLGPILAVMPWNFPFWQVFRFAAPALMAGNVAILKHSSNVPQCALEIETIFRDAGFPEGVFQTLLIGSGRIPALVQDSRIKAATLTGSDAAGRSVAQNAGIGLKKTVLELGGSDPFIVMESADIDEAVETAVKARTVNSGQSCIAAKRFIISETIADTFTARFVKSMEALKVGDPMDEATDIGPLATPQIRDEVEEQVRQSVAAGATLLTGGRIVPGRGNFYPPTVLANIPPGAPAYSEEVFGPVASLFRVSSMDEAIRLANATEFGLGASVWTSDEGEQKRFIDEIEAGQVFVNAMVASDPRLPFGGVKRSGYGRELGVFGIREFVNVKTVWIGGPKRASTAE